MQATEDPTYLTLKKALSNRHVAASQTRLHHAKALHQIQISIYSYPQPTLQCKSTPSRALPADHAQPKTAVTRPTKQLANLQAKKAIITGGDSGIGVAIAILFAMEGADSLITYLPDEEKDALETIRRVEEKEDEIFSDGGGFEG
jgi:hypothetical protein